METMSAADQTAAQDQLRTSRAFIGFLSSALGVDQTMPGEDGQASNAPGIYVVANPDGTFSTVGRSTSNVQGTGSKVAGLVLSPTLLLILLGVGFLILKL
jgi:hypothetical protein